MGEVRQIDWTKDYAENYSPEGRSYTQGGIEYGVDGFERGSEIPPEEKQKAQEMRDRMAKARAARKKK